MIEKVKKQFRCAIYTRKSHEDGLEQEFNSLDAQREACENYIASQKGNGWICLPESYDDGGFSGGNMNRPALQKLKADIKSGLVDIIVIYKIDRLTRSLSDFSELQEFFDEYDVSFVSITQEINTSTSAGRMMLNILMTFAQYEREIIAERIRDKVAAAKKRGKNCGGFPILGYDTDPTTKRLIVNESEAETVRLVFSSYLKYGSAKAVSTELELMGIRGKAWTTRKGVKRDGQKVNNQMIYRMLKNQLYIGMVEHKGNLYPGEHQAIIEQETWDQVQVMLKSNMNHDSTRRTPKVNPFAGMIYCGSCGGAFSLSHTVKQKNKRYSYYICLEDTKRNFSTCPIKRVPSDALEKLVLKEVGILFQTPTMLAQLMDKGDLGISAEQLQTVLKNIYEVWEVMNPAERCKLIQCVITRITVYENHIEIRPNLDGIKTLLAEAGMEV